MTPGQRLRFEHMTDSTYQRRFDLVPTVEDVRVLLKEIDRLTFAFDTAVADQAERAFAAFLQKGRRS